MKKTTFISLLGAFALTLTLVGCSTMPQEDLDAAQAALMAADSAEADVYVMDLYEAASDSFAVAQQEIVAKNYTHAQALLQYVTATATEAQNQVVDRKEEMRINNEQLILQAEQAVAQAQMLVSQTPQTGVVAPVSFEENATRASTDLEAAKTAQANSDYAQAYEMAQSALDKANALIEEIKTASTTPSTPQS